MPEVSKVAERKPNGNRRTIVSKTDTPKLKTVYQLRAIIPVPAGDSVEKTFQRAQDLVLGWMGQRFPKSIPTSTPAGNSFEVEIGGLVAQAVLLPDGLWAARLSHPDTPFKGRPPVPGRTWISEVSLEKAKGAVNVGIRVICGSLSFASDHNVVLTRPRIVLELAKLGLQELRPLDSIWRLSEEPELLKLRSLLEDPKRTLPVIVLTQPGVVPGHPKLPSFVLDHETLARDLIGWAHVALLPLGLAKKWAALIGNRWSVGDGSVRTYLPQFRIEEDSPSGHPAASLGKILTWGGTNSLKSFQRFLGERAQRACAAQRVDWNGMLFFVDAKAKAAEGARESSQESGFLAEAYEAELQAHREQLLQSRSETNDWVEQYEQLEKQFKAVSEENARLRFQSDQLRSQLAAKLGRNPDTAIEIPSSYEELPEWVEANLSGRLHLHQRAVREIKNAIYENPKLVYEALLLLANEYRQMRRSQLDKKDFDGALNKLGLKLDESITPSKASAEGDEYFVYCPFGSGKRQFLKYHLRKGTSRNPRYCLAIYFYWEVEQEKVVVGWLPSHLDNELT